MSGRPTRGGLKAAETPTDKALNTSAGDVTCGRQHYYRLHRLPNAVLAYPCAAEFFHGGQKLVGGVRYPVLHRGDQPRHLDPRSSKTRTVLANTNVLSQNCKLTQRLSLFYKSLHGIL
jgi:hypothetical protein